MKHNIFLGLALGLILVPAFAHADREYILIGPRHTFLVGNDWKDNLDRRVAIEKEYADDVALLESAFQKDIDNGVDPYFESEQFDSIMDKVSSSRDHLFSDMYRLDDSFRDDLPELPIQGDGYYELVRIDYHMSNGVQVIEDFVPYAPWFDFPLECSRGWNYGIRYTPDELQTANNNWSKAYAAFGLKFSAFVGSHGQVSWTLGTSFKSAPERANRDSSSRPAYGASISAQRTGTTVQRSRPTSNTFRPNLRPAAPHRTSFRRKD